MVMAKVTDKQAAWIRSIWKMQREGFGLKYGERPARDEPGYLTLQRLATIFGVSQTTIFDIANGYSHQRRPRRKIYRRYSEAEKREAARRYMDGEPARVIGQKIGASPTSVINWAKEEYGDGERRGWPARQDWRYRDGAGVGPAGGRTQAKDQDSLRQDDAGRVPRAAGDLRDQGSTAGLEGAGRRAAVGLQGLSTLDGALRALSQA